MSKFELSKNSNLNKHPDFGLDNLNIQSLRFANYLIGG